ncbi:MAG: hypothetical protein ACYDIA_20490 [Candidatus Humimicrobiaceae bacterium]
MKNLDGESFLEKEFPKSLRSKFIPIFKNAYDATNQFVESEEMFNWEEQKNIKPHIRRMAVEFQLKKMIETGNLNIAYGIKENSANNFTYMELYTENSISTICQVKGANQYPRDSLFRNNLSLSNQLRFNFLEPEFNNETNKKYLILTHGGDLTPEFINIGIPSSENNRFIYKINLLEEIYAIDNGMIYKEENIVELRDHLQKVAINESLFK